MATDTPPPPPAGDEDAFGPIERAEFAAAQREHERLRREQHVWAKILEHAVGEVEVAVSNVSQGITALTQALQAFDAAVGEAKGVVEQMNRSEWIRSPAEMALIRRAKPGLVGGGNPCSMP